MTFTFAHPRAQYFSFPSNIIYRLWKHPKSSTGILKIYQCCKYFYSKQKVAFFDEIIYSKGYRRSFDSAVLKFPHNVLFVSLYNMLIITTEFPPFLINYFTMSRYYNITSLELRYLNLKYEEFKILTSITTIEEFSLLDSELCYFDNTPVTIDAVLEKMPNVVRFEYENAKDDYPLEALEKLKILKMQNKFEFFSLTINALSDTFNPVILCKFIEKYCNGRLGLITKFTNQIKGKSLKKEINKIVSSGNGPRLSVIGGTIFSF